MTSIPRISADAPAEQRIDALAQAGAVVVTDALDPVIRDAIVAELEPHLAHTPAETDVAEDDFYPGHTKRLTALIARSETFRGLVTHPALLGACDAFLAPNCSAYQVHVATALVIGPGARTQVLHREDDSYPFFATPRPDLVVASMWAVSDFTVDNGATLIVPGSHRWPAERTARPEEVVPAEMPAGSLLIWMGGTLHGAGPNVSADWRYGLFLSYSLGWLRQEENQYLDVPWSVAETLPKELRSLVGYKMHRGLGFYDPGLPR